MSLIKSISGIRGTIGGKRGHNLTPVDIVEFTSAFATFIKQQYKKSRIVVGRDGRATGNSIKNLVIHTLIMSGIDVYDLDYSTTPTVEMSVTELGAQGGIIITASHNPMDWNALKFLNHKGEFISAEDGAYLEDYISGNIYSYASFDGQGQVIRVDNAIERHIDEILNLGVIDAKLIRSKKFKAVLDPVNSTGCIAITQLLDRLGCAYKMINGEMKGRFNRVAEPREEHLDELCRGVRKEKADLGIAVDPDVDRVAFVDEGGRFIGEEYSLVLAADFILSKEKGSTVSNMSSSRALRDLTHKYKCDYWPSAVGEVNVVEMMKVKKSVIGGEGNGGIIYPTLHYGRDAVLGVAFVLNLMAERQLGLSELRNSYSNYEIVKDKIDLNPDLNIKTLIHKLAKVFKNDELNTSDGLKIDFDEGWVHIRKSNTENIIRIIAESSTLAESKRLVENIKTNIGELL